MYVDAVGDTYKVFENALKKPISSWILGDEYVPYFERSENSDYLQKLIRMNEVKHRMEEENEEDSKIDVSSFLETWRWINNGSHSDKRGVEHPHYDLKLVDWDPQKKYSPWYNEAE